MDGRPDVKGRRGGELSLRRADEVSVTWYRAVMKSTVSSNGRIVIPAAIRRQDRIEPGQEFDIVRIGPGEYRLKRLKHRSKKGLVDRLLACPVKGWFVPIESESTNTL